MFPHVLRPSSDDSLGLVIVAAPIVYLLCWLYNAHRLGKFKKKKSANAAYDPRREKITLAIFVLALCIGLPLLLQLLV